jgi:hypothetical protein
MKPFITAVLLILAACGGKDEESRSPELVGAWTTYITDDMGTCRGAMTLSGSNNAAEGLYTDCIDEGTVKGSVVDGVLTLYFTSNTYQPYVAIGDLEYNKINTRLSGSGLDGDTFTAYR